MLLLLLISARYAALLGRKLLHFQVFPASEMRAEHIELKYQLYLLQAGSPLTSSPLKIPTSSSHPSMDKCSHTVNPQCFLLLSFLLKISLPGSPPFSYIFSSPVFNLWNARTRQSPINHNINMIFSSVFDFAICKPLISNFCGTEQKTFAAHTKKSLWHPELWLQCLHTDRRVSSQHTHVLLSDSDRGHTDTIQGAISSTFVAVFLIHKILQHREIARTVCTLILLCILPRRHACVEARGVEQEFPPALPAHHPAQSSAAWRSRCLRTTYCQHWQIQDNAKM